MSTQTKLDAWVATAAALLLLAAGMAQATVNTATNSGNWEAATTW